MKKLSVLAIALLAVLVAAAPLIAQAPAPSHTMQPPVRVMPGPQNPSSPTGILPREFRSAYGFNQIPNQGQGQTIAIVDAFDDPNIVSDLAFYANYFNFAPCNFTKVKLGTITGQGWDLEESLDVEQACAIAPSANIVLVEAATNNDSDLYAAVQLATQAPYNATVVSMSWGEGEFNGEQSNDSYFCNIVNGNGQAVTFLAASGDGGHGTIYPAASHCVIAAGGTELALSTAVPGPNPFTITYGHEQAWSGSGGGLSPYEPQPSYQNPACATWSTSERCVPDIASVSFNIPVYDTYSYGGWVGVEGTSIASPDWASFFTLVNSGRALAGHGSLSQANYDLYQIYYSSNYSTDFHDITTGTNGGCGSQCTASTGYDLVTGIGSYQANNLYRALLGVTN
ncbi:MAG: S53 family peptidase [Candidatus Korobacteraceae bacterium]